MIDFYPTSKPSPLKFENSKKLTDESDLVGNFKDPFKNFF